MTLCAYAKKCRKNTGGFRMCKKHREAARGACQKWAKSRKGKRKRRSYRAKNKKKLLATCYAWREKNKRRVLTNNRKLKRRRFFHFRARLLRHTKRGSATAKDLARMWHKQRGACPLTGRKLTRETAHLDHVKPLSKGGSKHLSNLRWLHADVNKAKAALTDKEFIQLCKEVVKFQRN